MAKFVYCLCVSTVTNNDYGVNLSIILMDDAEETLPNTCMWLVML